jgi:hypothetical protein
MICRPRKPDAPVIPICIVTLIARRRGSDNSPTTFVAGRGEGWEGRWGVLGGGRGGVLGDWCWAGAEIGEVLLNAEGPRKSGSSKVRAGKKRQAGSLSYMTP